MSEQKEANEVVTEYLLKSDDFRETITELQSVAERHANVVRELLRSTGDVQSLSDLPKQLMASSLQTMLQEDLDDDDTLKSRLAQFALDQVDWIRVATSVTNVDRDTTRVAA